MKSKSPMKTIQKSRTMDRRSSNTPKRKIFKMPASCGPLRFNGDKHACRSDTGLDLTSCKHNILIYFVVIILFLLNFPRAAELPQVQTKIR